MKVTRPAPPERVCVVEVIEVDFDLIAQPVTLGPRVQHSLTDESGTIFLLPVGGTMTLGGVLTCIVEMSDGTVARGTKRLVNLLLQQCGQATI